MAGVLWAVLISAFSTGRSPTSTLPGHHSDSALVFPARFPLHLLHMHPFIRKSAHFMEYFVFSLLILRAIRPAGGMAIDLGVGAMVIVAGYAALDEFPSIIRARTDAGIQGCAAGHIGRGGGANFAPRFALGARWPATVSAKDSSANDRAVTVAYSLCLIAHPVRNIRSCRS